MLGNQKFWILNGVVNTRERKRERKRYRERAIEKIRVTFFRDVLFFLRRKWCVFFKKKRGGGGKKGEGRLVKGRHKALREIMFFFTDIEAVTKLTKCGNAFTLLSC